MSVLATYESRKETQVNRLIGHSKVLVYLLESADDVVGRMVLVDVVPFVTVVLERVMLAGPDAMIEKVVVTPGAYVVTTKMYVPPD